MPDTTLLEKAKARVLRHSAGSAGTDEELDLAVAWAAGDITLVQVMAAFDTANTSSTYIRLACLLRQAVRDGKIIPV